MSKPFDLNGLRTYELQSRPSKVFVEDLGRPVDAGATIDDWLASLPRQLAAEDIRRVRDLLFKAHDDKKTIVAALGGHVIKTGCGPYLVDWVERGLLSGVVMNGAAAIHDLELAIAGKTSEDVAKSLPLGEFGFARDTADAFAVASHVGAQDERGLGWALGKHLDEQNCPHGECSLLLAAYRAGIPCTVHVAMGADIVHMHPHVSGAALGEASLIDFRKVISVVTTMENGVWMNIGSAVLLPEVFLKAVSVARNFGHSLAGMATVNIDKQVQYRSAVNVLDRPAAVGIQLTGHHEVLIPLLHAAVASRLNVFVERPQSLAA